MIAQGEHDPKSLSVLVSLDELLASAVVEELDLQTETSAEKRLCSRA